MQSDLCSQYPRTLSKRTMKHVLRSGENTEDAPSSPPMTLRFRRLLKRLPKQGLAGQVLADQDPIHPEVSFLAGPQRSL